MQVQTLYGNKVLAAFGVPLKDIGERFSRIEISARVTTILTQIEREQSTPKVRILYLRADYPVVRVSIHGIKKIVLTINNAADGKELATIVKSLFEKKKITNLSILVQYEFKQTRKNVVINAVDPPAT